MAKGDHFSSVAKTCIWLSNIDGEVFSLGDDRALAPQYLAGPEVMAFLNGTESFRRLGVLACSALM